MMNIFIYYTFAYNIGAEDSKILRTIDQKKKKKKKFK